MVAVSSAETWSPPFFWLTSTPASSSATATSVKPWRAANRSGVIPPWVCTCSLMRYPRLSPGVRGRPPGAVRATGATARVVPLAISALAASRRPSGFSPLALSAIRSITRVLAFGLAPRATSSFTTSTRLAAAAKMSAVCSRSRSFASRSAPPR